MALSFEAFYRELITRFFHPSSYFYYSISEQIENTTAAGPDRDTHQLLLFGSLMDKLIEAEEPLEILDSFSNEPGFSGMISTMQKGAAFFHQTRIDQDQMKNEIRKLALAFLDCVFNALKNEENQTILKNTLHLTDNQNEAGFEVIEPPSEGPALAEPETSPEPEEGFGLSESEMEFASDQEEDKDVLNKGGFGTEFEEGGSIASGQQMTGDLDILPQPVNLQNIFQEKVEKKMTTIQDAINKLAADTGDQQLWKGTAGLFDEIAEDAMLHGYDAFEEISCKARDFIRGQLSESNIDFQIGVSLLDETHALLSSLVSVNIETPPRSEIENLLSKLVAPYTYIPSDEPEPDEPEFKTEDLPTELREEHDSTETEDSSEKEQGDSEQSGDEYFPAVEKEVRSEEVPEEITEAPSPVEFQEEGFSDEMNSEQEFSEEAFSQEESSGEEITEEEFSELALSDGGFSEEELSEIAFEEEEPAPVVIPDEAHSEDESSEQEISEEVYPPEIWEQVLEDFSDETSAPESTGDEASDSGTADSPDSGEVPESSPVKAQTSDMSSVTLPGEDDEELLSLIKEVSREQEEMKSKNGASQTAEPHSDADEDFDIVTPVPVSIADELSGFKDEGKLHFDLMDEALKDLEESAENRSALDDLELASDSLEKLAHKLDLEPLAEYPAEVFSLVKEAVVYKFVFSQVDLELLRESLSIYKEIRSEAQTKDKDLANMITMIKGLRARIKLNSGLDDYVEERKDSFRLV